MRNLDPTEYQVIDLYPARRHQPTPVRPYPQYTELLAGLMVVCLLVGSVSYLTAFSYRWIEAQSIEQGR